MSVGTDHERGLLFRWLTTDPEAYDRMVDQGQMAAYVATIDEPLLAACRGRVLELACGIGRLLSSVGALPEVQHAVGLDIAPRMLAAAAARDHRLLVQASAEALPFAPDHFDTVICAFYTLRDLERSKVYTEAARALRPGGILAFTLRSYYAAYLETLWRDFLRYGRCPRSWRHLDGADGVERNLRDVGRGGRARARRSSSTRDPQRALPPVSTSLDPPGLLARRDRGTLWLR